MKTKPSINLDEQRNLLSIHPSGVYYKPKRENVLNLQLMKIIDKYFIKHTYFEVELMKDYSRLYK